MITILNIALNILANKNKSLNQPKKVARFSEKRATFFCEHKFSKSIDILGIFVKVLRCKAENNYMLNKFFRTLIIYILVISCHPERNRTRNPNVPLYRFSIEINMELPTYNNLLYPSNAVLVNLVGAGTNGIIVFNAGGNYRAYEANCPNQGVTTCSQLQINGIRAVCPCDEFEYSLFTGIPVSQGDYTMIPYRIEQIGNVLRIWN